MKAIYVGGKLVAPGGCPICAGTLTPELKCTRPSCGKQWGCLAEIQRMYDALDNVAAIRDAHMLLDRAKRRE
jgi:hypothetical protein